MWKSPFSDIDPVTKSTGAALLCSVFTQHLSSRQIELSSETLAWVILPFMSRIAGRLDIDKFARTPRFLPINSVSQPLPVASLWVVALGIVTACLFRAEFGIIEFFPILTPLFVIAQRHLGSELRPSTRSGTGFFSPFVNTVLGTALAAAFVVLTLSDWNPREHALSIIPVATLLIAYVTLTPRNGKRSRFIPPLDIEGAIRPLSLRIEVLLVVALGVETVVFGFPSINVVTTSILGFTKALSWYFTIQTTRHSSWRIAIAIGAFSIVSTRDPFTQSSGLQALAHVVTSFLTLGQLIHTLPKQAKAKSALWTFSLVFLGPYFANILAIEAAQSSLLLSQAHPVEVLFHQVKEDFEALLQRQSKSYAAAHEEYVRRYGADPPPGFEAWYEFAKSHQSPIIDEFDAIYDNISPFWRLGGKEVLGIMTRVYSEPNSEMWFCSLSGEQARTDCSHRYRTYDRNIQFLFNRLLRDLRGVLPDVKFLVNHLDEPRVLVPPRSLEEEEEEPHIHDRFNLTNVSRRPVWDMLTKFCSHDVRKESVQARVITETFDIPFVSDRSFAMDLCRHPEYGDMHGLAISPNSFRLVEGLVPALSTGSPSTMGDILYPSPAYIESEFQYAGAHDVEWDEKRNNLYWAGSTTGGFALDDQWRSFHRQRFVALAKNLERRPHYYLRERAGVVSRVRSSFLNSRLFDVAFTRIFQCERKHCRDQRRHFAAKPWADPDQAFRSRLVFDADGNGISGRFYKVLASRSVPLKQTLLREWHDERLVPWVHYVPVSQSMEELPELVFYLTSTEAGRRRAREIAEHGRDWFSKAFRDVDMAIYTYRLLLELARLQDPERPAEQVHAE